MSKSSKGELAFPFGGLGGFNAHGIGFRQAASTDAAETAQMAPINRPVDEGRLTA